jgi:hypothetical protein
VSATADSGLRGRLDLRRGGDLAERSSDRGGRCCRASLRRLVGASAGRALGGGGGPVAIEIALVVGLRGGDRAVSRSRKNGESR